MQVILVNHSDQSLNYFHTWAGPALESAWVVSSLPDIAHVLSSIIICSPYEANCHLDLACALSRHNRFVFVLTGEVDTHDMQCVQNTNEFRHASFVLGGINNTVWHLNVNSFFFLTLTDCNRLTAERILPDIFGKVRKPFSFRYLNGHERPHRKLLWQVLQGNNSLDRSLCSYLGYTNDGNTSDIDMVVLPDCYESPYRDLAAWQHGRSRATAVRYYWQNFPAQMQIIPRQFIDTYFTLEAESSVDHFFATEKTFKPLLAGHPFLILGCQGFYQHLHDLGFRTFSPMIDESFDFEPDVNVRVRMIAQEVSRLCAGDLDGFLESVRDICIYNQQHYVNSYWPRFKQSQESIIVFLNTVSDRARSTMGGSHEIA